MTMKKYLIEITDGSGNWTEIMCESKHEAIKEAKEWAENNPFYLSVLREEWDEIYECEG